MTSNNIPRGTEMSQQQMPSTMSQQQMPSTSADYIGLSNPGQQLPGFPFPNAQHIPVCTAPNSYPPFGTFGGMMPNTNAMQMTSSPLNLNVHIPDTMHMHQGMQMASSPPKLNMNTGNSNQMSHAIQMQRSGQNLNVNSANVNQMSQGIQMQSSGQNLNVNSGHFHSAQSTGVPFAPHVR